MTRRDFLHTSAAASALAARPAAAPPAPNLYHFSFNDIDHYMYMADAVRQFKSDLPPFFDPNNVESNFTYLRAGNVAEVPCRSWLSVFGPDPFTHSVRLWRATWGFRTFYVAASTLNDAIHTIRQWHPMAADCLDTIRSVGNLWLKNTQ